MREEVQSDGVSPLDDRVLLRRVESDERTKGGIIPDPVKEKPYEGEVGTVGLGVLPHLDVDRRGAPGVTSAFTKDRDAAWRKSA